MARMELFRDSSRRPAIAPAETASAAPRLAPTAPRPVARQRTGGVREVRQGFARGTEGAHAQLPLSLALLQAQFGRAEYETYAPTRTEAGTADQLLRLAVQQQAEQVAHTAASQAARRQAQEQADCELVPAGLRA